MSSEPPFQPCCLKSFAWTGTPTGHTTTLSPLSLPTYKTSPSTTSPSTSTTPSTNSAILLIHDALGWTFPNARLLADHLAREAHATVYMPDFFGGEVLSSSAILAGRSKDLDMVGFRQRNSRERREREIVACARALKGDGEDGGYERVGAVGYCWGGWGVLRLAGMTVAVASSGENSVGEGEGKEEGNQQPLVDAVVAGHPSWLTKSDIDGVNVPIMFLAPETDGQFTDELKEYAFRTLVLGQGGPVGRKKVPVEYVHFPGVKHGCLTKGDERVEGEREAMVRGKDAAVQWFRQWLG